MRIGLLVGMEESFPKALLERWRAHAGVTAELVTVGAVAHDSVPPYDVVVDRISHEIGCYQSMLAAAVAGGVRVVNNPFRARLSDRFLDVACASRLGIRVPKTVLLPQKDYAPTITPASLRNLQYPIPWAEVLAGVGGVGWVRAASPHAWRHSVKVSSVDELLRAYDRSGAEVTLLQEHVKADRYLRVVVVGGDKAIVARFDPEYRLHLVDPDYLSAGEEETVVKTASAVATAFGLDLCAVEIALEGGVPFLVDVVATPDLEVATLTPFYFDRVVQTFADHILALAERGAAPTVDASLAPLLAASGPIVAHLTPLAPTRKAEPRAAPKKAGSSKPRKKSGGATAEGS